MFCELKSIHPFFHKQRVKKSNIIINLSTNIFILALFIYPFFYKWDIKKIIYYE